MRPGIAVRPEHRAVVADAEAAGLEPFYGREVVHLLEAAEATDAQLAWLNDPAAPAHSQPHYRAICGVYPIDRHDAVVTLPLCRRCFLSARARARRKLRHTLTTIRRLGYQPDQLTLYTAPDGRHLTMLESQISQGEQHLANA